MPLPKRPRHVLANGNVSAFTVFHGTHTGPGGPCPPTGKSVATDYVYVMQFDGDRISGMTKVWHSGLAMKALVGADGRRRAGAMWACQTFETVKTPGPAEPAPRPARIRQQPG
jgi:hypothetical protein